MDFLEPAKKQSGKERARKSRQRKKKYYDDLESLNQHLQKQVDKLTKEVEYYKQRLKTLEWNNEPTSVRKCQEFEDFFVNNVVDEIKKIPDYKKVLEIGRWYWKDYGPFGVERVKIIDSAFTQILDNLVFPTNKLFLYIADKDIPITKDQFERYKTMKKFEQYENYPDPFVRFYIEEKINWMYGEDEYKNYEENSSPLMKMVKQELKKGIKMLIEAKNQICHTMMINDIYK